MSKQHGKETNLPELKALAKALLQFEPELTEFSPMLIYHPFTSSGIVAVTDAEGNPGFGNILENPEDMRKWRQQMERIIGESDSAIGIYNLIEKQYVMGFLKHAAPYLTREDYSVILADAWSYCDQPNYDPNLPKSRLLAMFRAADPKLLMNDSEREMFGKLDDTVTVYRGVRSARSDGLNAMSWTLSRETAEWFASRYGRQGKVYEARIEKQHILALFLDKNESEVVLNPRHLTDITQVLDLQQAQNMTEQTM